MLDWKTLDSFGQLFKLPKDDVYIRCFIRGDWEDVTWDRGEFTTNSDIIVEFNFETTRLDNWEFAYKPQSKGGYSK